MPIKQTITDSFPARGILRDWLWGLGLVLAVIVTYLPVWRAGFIWDDDYALTINPVVVGPLGLREIWTTSAGDVCPLTITTFWLEHKLWGLPPLPYHLVNVLLHGFNAVVLWRVLCMLRIPGAWLGAALWALHPVQVDTVTWITELKNTQSGLFYLLSILFFVRWLQARNDEKHGGWNWTYAAAFLFAAMAMASKSSTVILPLVLGLVAWWIEGRWKWRNGVSLLPFFFLSAIASAYSLWTQSKELAAVDGPQWARTWPERLVTVGDEVWFYLGKLLWPHPLMNVYPRWQIASSHFESYLPLLAIVIIGLILWLKRDSWGRPYFFVLGYFLVALLPMLGLLDLYFQHYSWVSDRYQYLASMGPLALAAAGFVRVADVVLAEKTWLRPTLAAGLLSLFGIISWQHAWVYQNEETLWTYNLAKNPNWWLGYNNLGRIRFQEGKIDEAIADYQRCLAINPSYALAHFNLGLALSQKDQSDAALDEFRKALELYPGFVDAHYNYGIGLFQKGRMDEAMVEFQKVLELNPKHIYAHNNLGLSLFEKGQVDDAMAQYREALQIDPGFADAHYNLGLALIQKGAVGDAITEFQKAVRLNPGDSSARQNLARARAVFLQKQ